MERLIKFGFGKKLTIILLPDRNFRQSVQPLVASGDFFQNFPKSFEAEQVCELAFLRNQGFHRVTLVRGKQLGVFLEA